MGVIKHGNKTTLVKPLPDLRPRVFSALYAACVPLLFLRPAVPQGDPPP